MSHSRRMHSRFVLAALVLLVGSSYARRADLCGECVTYFSGVFESAPDHIEHGNGSKNVHKAVEKLCLKVSRHLGRHMREPCLEHFNPILLDTSAESLKKAVFVDRACLSFCY